MTIYVVTCDFLFTPKKTGLVSPNATLKNLHLRIHFLQYFTFLQPSYDIFSTHKNLSKSVSSSPISTFNNTSFMSEF